MGLLLIIVGFDCVLHMPEEVQDASLTMSNARNAKISINAIFGLGMVITIAFTIGDVDSVLATPIGMPAAQWTPHSTGYVRATIK